MCGIIKIIKNRASGLLILRERGILRFFFLVGSFFTFTFGNNISAFPLQELFLIITAKRLHQLSVHLVNKPLQAAGISAVIIQQIVTLSKYGHDALDICHL